MSGFLVITEPEDSAGFRCAGFDCIEVKEGDGVSELLLTIMNEGKYGLVAIDQRLLDKVPENVMRRIKKRGQPIVMHINIPRKWEEKEFGESPIVRLIRSAIGYQIKIKK